MIRPLAVVVLCLMAASCATGKGNSAPSEPPEPEAQQAPDQSPTPTADMSTARPVVTYTVEKETTLGGLLPDFAEAVGGSLIIMNGLQQAPVKPASWQRQPFEQVVRQLVTSANLLVEDNPSYYFIHAKGYESLKDVSLEGRLDPAYADVKASLGFGYGTPLFEALALLGGSTGVTVVADQMIGDTRTGSLNLAMSGLHACLEGLLKSARVPQDAFEVESNPEYIFIHAKANAPRLTLLNAQALTPEQNALLDRKVTAAVPTSPLDVRRVGKLKDALPVLSRQLGVEVAAEPGLEDLPVSPTYLKEVRLRTVMDLIIRQWPVAEFGYILQPSGDTVRLIIQRTR